MENILGNFIKKAKVFIALAKKKFKSSRNNSIILFLVIFLGGYFLLFTSKSWLDNGNTEKKYTVLNTVETIDNRSLKLVKWNYCESTSTMEIEIEINNTTYDGINSFIFGCNDRKGKNYKVDAIITSPTLTVIQIQNVNVKKLSEIRLTMQVDYGGRKSEEMAKFYTNNDQVDKVEEIITYNTLDSYYLAKLDKYIIEYKKQITDLTTKITEQNGKLTNYNAVLNDLTKQQNYVAADELEKVNKEIADTKNGINECTNSIKDFNTSIKETEKKIQNTQAIKEVYK